MGMKQRTPNAVRLVHEQVALCPAPTPAGAYWEKLSETYASAIDGTGSLSSIEWPPLPGPPSPRVGVAAYNEKGELLGVARRGEADAAPNDHAEFNLLRKLEPGALIGGTLYTSLEPCTPNVRSENKKACVQRVIEARPRRVMVGMLDPNREIRGHGVYMLQESGIEVGLFDSMKLRELNKEFVRYYDQTSDVGDMALHSVRKLSHALWHEALSRYRQDQSGEALQNCEHAARCFNWAEFWIIKRARLRKWTNPKEARGKIPTHAEMDAGYGWAEQLDELG